MRLMLLQLLLMQHCRRKSSCTAQITDLLFSYTDCSACRDTAVLADATDQLFTEKGCKRWKVTYNSPGTANLARVLVIPCSGKREARHCAFQQLRQPADMSHQAPLCCAPFLVLFGNFPNAPPLP